MDTDEAALLAISKAAFQELMQAFPEHWDAITASLLDVYSLAKDGSETRGGGAAGKADDGAAQMRKALKARASADLCCTGVVAPRLCGTVAAESCRGVDHDC